MLVSTSQSTDNLFPSMDIDSNNRLHLAYQGLDIADNGTEIYYTITVGAVPVELSSFDATYLDGKVILQWITATESNNFGFEIERSHGSETFNKIGSMAGNGTTAIPKFYTYVDRDIQHGLYTYRLKQVDFDGTFSYSHELEIVVKAPPTYRLQQNYPNPFNPETVIQYQLRTSSEVEISIYNSLGRKIRMLVNETKEAGEHQIQWDGKNASGKIVASGTYYYTLKVDGKALFTKPMLLLK